MNAWRLSSWPGCSERHCKLNIEESLEEVNGVGGCNVDLDAKRVTVDYDPAAVDPTAITAAIEDAGYPVS